MPNNTNNRKLLIAVPLSAIDQANEVALALGPSDSDDHTFRVENNGVYYNQSDNSEYVFSTPVVTESIVQLFKDPHSMVDGLVQPHARVTPEYVVSAIESGVALYDDPHNVSPIPTNPDKVGVVVFEDDSPIQDLESVLSALGLQSSKVDISDEILD